MVTINAEGTLVKAINLNGESNIIDAPITIAELLELSNDELTEFLLSHQFQLNHFEKMGELFHLLSNESTQRLNCLNKSLTLYNYVHTHSTTYSSERVNQIRKIEEEITRNDLP